MLGPSTTNTPQPEIQVSAATRRTGLSMVIFIFFMWGFITVLNDILVPHLKGVFQLDYFRASLIQFAFFTAYFIMSLPAGKIVSSLGYQKGMVVGLLVSAAGTLLFYPAATILSYNLFLTALFVLATGITILQVAANPYISVLGKPETAASRLNLAQAFNSLGTTIAPYVGGILILGAVSSIPVNDHVAQAAAVRMPYLGLTALLVVLAIVVGLVHLPQVASAEEDKSHQSTFSDVFKKPHLVLGAIGIFVYVGAEVSIGSYLISFFNDPEIAGLSPEKAAHYVSYYWFGAMVGRFLGSWLGQHVRANRMLAINAGIAVALCGCGLFFSGHLAMYSILAIGLFNSVMFPTIFTLGIANLGHLTGRGSSLLIMAIFGGALIPVLMGHAADVIGIHHSFFIPAACYLYIVYYAVAGYKKA